MNHLRLVYEGMTSWSRDPDPEDEYDNGTSETSWYLQSLHLTDLDIYDSVPNYLDAKVGDDVYVVYAVYSTGDSFGQSNGARLEYINVFSSADDAFAAKRALEDRTVANPVYKLSNGEEVSLGYVPWSGYFESLDYIQVEKFKVKPQCTLKVQSR